MKRLKNLSNCHALTIDLESWVFSEKINSYKLNIEQLRKLEAGYIHEGLSYLLKVLKQHNQHITFFVVTKLEDMYPGILEKIKKDGHEIGWHSHTHAKIINSEVLIRELKAAKKYITEYKMIGFQAPQIYFYREGYNILKEYGFAYSSSIYGNSKYVYDFDGVIEFPVSVSNLQYSVTEEQIVFPNNLQSSKLFNYRIPYGSGLFWGLLGKEYYSKKLKEMNSQKIVSNLFIHDWQLVRPTSEEYKKDVSFFWNPWFTPYKINVSFLFEELLSNYRFKRMKDFIL